MRRCVTTQMHEDSGRIRWICQEGLSTTRRVKGVNTECRAKAAQAFGKYSVRRRPHQYLHSQFLLARTPKGDLRGSRSRAGWPADRCITAVHGALSVLAQKTVESLLLSNSELTRLDARMIDTKERVDIIHRLCTDICELLDLSGRILDLEHRKISHKRGLRQVE